MKIKCICPSILLVVDEFEFHVDDVDIVLVNLFLMFKDLVASRELAEFKLHFFLPGHLLQLL